MEQELESLQGEIDRLFDRPYYRRWGADREGYKRYRQERDREYNREWMRQYRAAQKQMREGGKQRGQCVLDVENFGHEAERE